jgi:hypothetical protein
MQKPWRNIKIPNKYYFAIKTSNFILSFFVIISIFFVVIGGL